MLRSLDASAAIPLEPVRDDHAQRLPGSEALQANRTKTELTFAERLRELADLHREGILSDEEFASDKSKSLQGL